MSRVLRYSKKHWSFKFQISRAQALRTFIVAAMTVSDVLDAHFHMTFSELELRLRSFTNKGEEKSPAEEQSRSVNSEYGLEWRYLNLNSELMIQLVFHFVKLH